MWGIHYKLQCWYLKENIVICHIHMMIYWYFPVIRKKMLHTVHDRNRWSDGYKKEVETKKEKSQFFVLSNRWLDAERLHKSDTKWPKGLWCCLPHKQQHTHAYIQGWTYTQVMYDVLLDVAQGEYVFQTLGSVWFITCLQMCDSLCVEKGNATQYKTSFVR